MHAQYGIGMSHVGFSEFGTTAINEGVVSHQCLQLYFFHFSDEKRYEFVWDIKTE